MAATLVPFPKFRAFSPSGAPLASGRLYSYKAGTTNPQSTYKDKAGVTANTNPVILNANGEADVWLGSGSYKLELRDATDVVLWTVDQVAGDRSTVDAGELTYAISSNYNAGTVGAKLRQLISAFDFMTATEVADVKARSRLVDVSGAMQQFFDACSNGTGFMPPGDYLCNTSLVARQAMTIIGAGINSTALVTTADIKQVTNDPAGTYSVTFQDLQVLNAHPVADVAGPSTTASTTSGNSAITVASATGLQKGIKIAGTGIPANTYIGNINGTTVTLANSSGTPVNATATGAGVAITTTFREGPTNAQFYIKNAGRWSLNRVYFKTAHGDNDYSPTNMAGLHFDRDASSQYFINQVTDCWFDHAPLIMGTSDSDIMNCTIWANPFDFALKICAPNIRVVGGSVSAGVLRGIWITATGTETFGNANHSFTGVGIDGGDIWYSGYGVEASVPLSCVWSGCKFMNIRKAAVRMTDATAVTISGNSFINNNADDLNHSDVEIVGTALQPTTVINANVFLQTNVRTNPGWAIREVNAGNYPASSVYTDNQVSSNYTGTGISIATPLSAGVARAKQSGNAGAATAGDSGTWTPVIAGSSTAGSHTYNSGSTKGVWYLDENGWCHIDGSIVLTAKDGTMAGVTRITGLPFTANSAQPHSSFSVGSEANITHSAATLSLRIDAGTNYLRVFHNGSAAATTELAASGISGTSEIYFSGKYRV